MSPMSPAELGHGKIWILDVKKYDIPYFSNTEIDKPQKMYYDVANVAPETSTLYQRKKC